MAYPRPLEDYQVPSQVPRKATAQTFANPANFWRVETPPEIPDGVRKIFSTSFPALPGKTLVLVSGIKLSPNKLPSEYLEIPGVGVSLLEAPLATDAVRISYIRADILSWSPWQFNEVATGAIDGVNKAFASALPIAYRQKNTEVEAGSLVSYLRTYTPFLWVWNQGIPIEYTFSPQKELLLLDAPEIGDLVETTYLPEF